MRRAALAVLVVGGAALLASSVGPAATTERSVAVTEKRFYLTTSEIAQLRASILKRKLPWAVGAWKRTKAVADDALNGAPSLPALNGIDLRKRGSGACGDGDDGWNDCLYQPGRNDGLRTLALAQAYAITQDRRYADKAREFLMAWAKGYDPTSDVGHAVADSVGFALKGFMAYDLVRDRLSPAERVVFRRWAGAFAGVGKRRVESYMDDPWIPEAPYGNSATWSRALAVLASAVVGGQTLDQTLAWNWTHRTPGGKDGSWANLLEGAIETRSGRMTEERVRQSIDYALYTWHPLLLIADLARRVGYSRNLFLFRTASGKGLLTVAAYYEPYLTKVKPTPYDETAARGGDYYEAALSEFRAASEVALRNNPKSAVLRRIVTYGGNATRAANYDPHITGFNGITGGALPSLK